MLPGQRTLAWVFACWLTVVTAQAAQTDALHEAVVELSVNDQTADMLIVLQDEAGNLWLEESDFGKFRLRTPDAEAHLYEKFRYLPLAAIDGVVVRTDSVRQRVDVSAPAEAFMPSRLSLSTAARPALTPAAAGGFLNYQISGQRIEGSHYAGAYAELGVFAAPGVFTNTAAFRAEPEEHTLVRLDTAFAHDLYERMERATLGDAISQSGSWGSATHFGGVSWGRDFSLRPDLVTTPLLSVDGSAVVPSTADIFVNGQKVATENLPPGPFVIDRLPAISGDGQVSVVVRDALGREQRISQPFYSSPTLLSAGLSQYSVDLGRIREDYGLRSNRYGDWLAAVTYRRGLNSAITVEGHGEALADAARAVGLNVAARIAQLGVFNVTAASGGDVRTTGALLGAGFDRYGAHLSFAFSTAVTTEGYRQVASTASGAPQFKRRDLLQTGIALGRSGSLALAYARQTYFSSPAQRTYGVTYNWSIRDWLIANLSATRTESTDRADSYFLTFTKPLDRRRVVSAGINGGSGGGAPSDEFYANYAQSPPLGTGFGYHAGASTARNYDVGGRWQARVGELDVQAARNQGVEGQSVFWSGATTLLGGDLRASRSTRNSFAVVDVGGIAGVPVYIDHQLVTHTDQNGRAFLHDLLPYQPNRINIEPVELPLDVEIDTRTYVVVPRYRSGVIARFPVERVRGGVFKLIAVEGRAVPVGAQVRFNGKLFPIGYDGLTYVTGYDHGMSGTAVWREGACDFRVPPPLAGDPLPDMGTIQCIAKPQGTARTP